MSRHILYQLISTILIHITSPTFRSSRFFLSFSRTAWPRPLPDLSRRRQPDLRKTPASNSRSAEDADEHSSWGHATLNLMTCAPPRWLQFFLLRFLLCVKTVCSYSSFPTLVSTFCIRISYSIFLDVDLYFWIVIRFLVSVFGLHFHLSSFFGMLIQILLSCFCDMLIIKEHPVLPNSEHITPGYRILKIFQKISYKSSIKTLPI